MNIFMDGITVLVNQIEAVFSILIAIVWGQVLITALFRKIFKDQLTSSETISLGLAGWILPAALLSALMFAGVVFLEKIAVTVISVFAVIALGYVLFASKLNRKSILAGFAFLVALTASLILQLAFLKNMLLPSYFDSAEHYRIIKYFAEYYASSSGSFPLINYYHVGFHLLSATVSYVFHLGIVDTMLVFGQVILAILPFSLFFIVRHETGSNVAAVFTCLLAGLGWHMPSHLMDWGKYPALFSLIGIQFVLNFGYLIYKNSRSQTESFVLYWLLIFGVLVSALLHTRSLFFFAFMGISLLLTVRIKHLLLLFQRIASVIVITLLVVEIGAVQNSAVLGLLFGTYVRQDIFVTGLILFLLIFSAWAFPNLTLFLLILISLMLAGLFVPVTGFMGYGSLTLLDRPYVQMLLYIPLSIFGGLGLAGFNQFLKKFSSLPKYSAQMVSILLIVFIVLNASSTHSFYPSDCCQIVSHDDLSAIHWMDQALPPDARVLIASADLYVTSLESPNTLTGVDGGIWVTPLISRVTFPTRKDASFEQSDVHLDLCKKNIGYIYVGGTSQSFDALQLDARPDWYQVAFSLPAAKVYKVIGCE